MLYSKTFMGIYNTRQNKKFFHSLTGIRAIAAWSVFLFHFNPFEKTTILGGFIDQLYIGVDIFFVLSGFLICYRYYDSVSLNRKWFSKYTINRVARIYPMFFILTSLTFLAGYISALLSSSFTLIQITKNTGFHYFMNLSFLKAFFYDLRFTGIPQAWTLTVEECFYFSAPLIFLSFSKIKLWIQPFIWLLIGILIVRLFEGDSIYGFFKDTPFMLKFTYFGRAFEFYVGIHLALIFLKNKELNFLKGNYTIIGLLGIISTLLFISIMEVALFPSYGKIILASFLVPLFIWLLFYGLLNEETYIKKILETKFMVFTGKSSYVFYLIHMGLFQGLINYYIGSSIWISFILLNILAALLFKFIEEPLNGGIRNWYAIRIEKKASVLNYKEM